LFESGTQASHCATSLSPARKNPPKQRNARRGQRNDDSGGAKVSRQADP
jgi:hypothetical protein